MLSPLALGVGLLLLAAAALFVAAETSLVAARRPRLEELAGAGRRSARRAVALRKDLHRSLRAAHAGAALAGLGFGAIVVPPLATSLASAIAGFGVTNGAARVTGALLGFAAAAVVFFLVAGVMARAAATARPEKVILASSWLLGAFAAAVGPLVAAASRVENARGEDGRERPGPEEIEALLRGARAEGVERDEEAMIYGVFELNRTIAREVMTPRPDIVAFPETASLEDVLARVAESGFSRFPVYRESIDEVTGVLLVKDLLSWIRGRDPAEFRLAQLTREPFFVPDSKPVDDLLAEFRRQKVHMAIVVDEFGGTDGVVTLEDLVEEIVGDIFDEHDVAEEEIERLPDGRVLLDGGAALADVIDEFDIEDVEDEEDYDTVAGYVIGRLGRIPVRGDSVPIGHSELEVIETQEQRVTRLELRLRSEDAGGIAEPTLEGERDP